MSLEAIVQRILAQGSAEAKTITDAARIEMESMLQQTRNVGQAEISRRLEEARKAAERLKIQEVARAELESRKIVLAAQKETLDAVKADVLRELNSPEHKRDILRALLEKHKEDWRAGKVYCNPVDQDQVGAVVGSRFGGTIECSGGFVIESEDASKRIDLMFETLLQDIWEDSVRELAGLLWPRH